MSFFQPVNDVTCQSTPALNIFKSILVDKYTDVLVWRARAYIAARTLFDQDIDIYLKLFKHHQL